MREEAIVDLDASRFRQEGFVGRAERILRLFDGLEGSGGEEGEDRGAEAGDVALRDQDRLVQARSRRPGSAVSLRLRDAAAVDDAVDGHAMLLHALENDAGVEGGAFDGGEQLVLRRCG